MLSTIHCIAPLHSVIDDGVGLTRRERLVPPAERLLALPRRYPANPPKPPGRRRLQPGGVELAASAGDAREYFSRQALVLDSCPPADAPPEHFETAVSVADSLIAPLGERPNGPDGLLDLILYAEGARTLTAGRGLLSTDAMLEALACVQPQPPNGFQHIADTLTARAGQHSACLLVLTAWDTQRCALVEQLRRSDMPVTVLLVTNGTEPPDNAPTDCILVDIDDPARSLALLR